MTQHKAAVTLLSRITGRITVIACVLGIAATGFILAVAVFQPAHASGGSASAGASSVRLKPLKVVAHGRLWLAPHGVVAKDRLPHCVNEDGSGSPRPCSWNLLRSATDHPDGNGRGLTYWVSVNRHVHYVWPERPLGSPVSSELADALAEGGGHHHWFKCWLDEPRTHVRCPDGFLVRVWGQR